MKSPAQDVFSEALRVCKPHLADTTVRGYLDLAEQLMIRRRFRTAVALCLLAAREAGEAEAHRRQLALMGG